MFSSDVVRVRRHGLYPEELIFILIVVIVWLVAVVLFYRQWDSIRILQPVEPRYKHNPKNLETIRIVKRAQDSVIYKSYSRKLSITMLEREKRRLQRMHTAPTLPTMPRLNTLPTIQMEDVELQRIGWQWVQLANKGRLLLRTPFPDPFRTCIRSNVETILN